MIAFREGTRAKEEEFKKDQCEDTSVKSDSAEPPDLAKLLFSEEPTVSNIKKKESPEDTSMKSDPVKSPDLAKLSFGEESEISNAKKTPRSNIVSHGQRSIPHGVEIIDLESMRDETADRRSAPRPDLIKLEHQDIFFLGEHQIKRENSIESFRGWKILPEVIEILDSDDELDQPASLQAKTNLSLPSEIGLDNIDADSPGTTVQTPRLGEIDSKAQIELSNEMMLRLQKAYAQNSTRRINLDGTGSILDPIDLQNGDSLLVDVKDGYARTRMSQRDAVATEVDDNKQNSDEELFLPSVSEILGKRTHQEMTDNDSAGNLEALPEGANNSRRARPINKRRIDEEKENEEMACLKASIEDFLMTAAEQERQGAKESKRKQGGRTASEKKLQRNRTRTEKSIKKPRGSKSEPTAGKRNSKRLGDLNDIGSLINADVSEDSNANLGRPELPVLPHKDKSKLLTALLAGLPPEDKRQSRGQRAQLLEATRILGNTSPDGQGNWKMKGMISSLYHYQVQGAALMRQWEDREDGPRGGLQADQMGLGKTIMMLATMVANQPGTTDPKPTLLVCTPALLTQWRREVDKHVEKSVFKRIIRFRSSSIEFFLGSDCKSNLEDNDLILATYQEVVKSYTKFKPPADTVDPEDMEALWDNGSETGQGLLHRIHFFRVILDEAHAIKNFMSHTSIACRALMGKCRWAISGTPVQNDVSELYPFFKFLRVKGVGTMKEFVRDFCTENLNNDHAKLHRELNKIMIRRTHKTQMFGSPIISLPKNTQRTLEIEFNAVEREVYETIRNRFIYQINKYSKTGVLEQNYRSIMVMLLRLRQLTGHIVSVQEIIKDLFRAKDLKKLYKLTTKEASKAKSQSRDMLWLMEKIISENKTPTANNSDNIISTDPPLLSTASDDKRQENEGENSMSLVRKFGKVLRELARNSKWTDLVERSSCGRCTCPPDDPWVTDCMHVYCKECLVAIAYEAAQNGKERADCQRCKSAFFESKPCDDLEGLTTWSNLTKEEVIRRKREDFIEWINKDGRILQSTKTAAVQAQIEQWLTSDPLKKIIVFSQFHTLMRVLGKICVQKGWKYCDFHGKMALEARDKAVAQFSQDPEIKIMIASLKCGGIGLNLTMASRVICVDLWWNKCIEQQAFCRIHRIGQKSETFVTRFIVKKTVDEELEKMQKRKALPIAEAIDNPIVGEKLSLHELMGLFGQVAEDAEGKPFVVAEDEGENEPAFSQDQDDLGFTGLPGERT